MADTDYDVAIVGLGPVGAAAANLCGTLGLRTLVLEQAREPHGLPRAIHFDAEAMRIFQSIGLADRLAAMTRPMGGSVYLGVDGRPIRRFKSRDTRDLLGWPASNLFYQPDLEALLREGLGRFPHLDAHLGAAVGSVRPNDDGATLTISGEGAPATARARFVLACDGASSPIRKAMGVKLDDMGFEERWLVIDAFVDGPMRWPDDYEIPEEVRDGRCSLMVCDPRRPATLIPGAGLHRRWEYMLLDGEDDADMVRPERIAALLNRWVDPAHVEVKRTAVYRFRGLVAHEWRRGPVFLMGDAAHQTPPFFGQGMCHGLRDAAQLIWKLKLVRDGLADDALLDSYQPERDGHVRAILTASVAAGAAVCILDPERARERDAAFRAEEAARGDAAPAMTDIVPPIRDGLIDATGGDRLPQPPVRAGGEPVRLDDRLGGRFTVLTASLETLPLERDPRWAVIDGQVLRVGLGADLEDTAGGLTGWMAERNARWVLVRPDRYVFGAAATTSDLSAMAERLFAGLHIAAATSTSRTPVPLEAA